MKKNQPYKPQKFDIAIINPDDTELSYQEDLQIYGHTNNLTQCCSFLMENLHLDDLGYYMYSKTYDNALIVLVLSQNLSSWKKPTTLYFICDNSLDLSQRQDIAQHILKMDEYLESDEYPE